MKTKRPWDKLGLIIAATLALSGAVIITACGKLKSENVPTSDPGLTLDVTNGKQDSEGRYTIRANGRQSIEVVATVKGLSSSVGFYVPALWGTFTGGTASLANGFTYYTADRQGKARATLVASAAGRIEMVVRSLDVEKTLPLSFEFATFMFFPNAITITDTFHYILYTRGGLPPIDFVVDLPLRLSLASHGDSIEIWANGDPNYQTAIEKVTVSAIDAEGQTATAVVTLSQKSILPTTCVASALTAEPAAPLSGSGAATISVMVIDYSRVGAASVSVELSGGISGTIPLAQWGTPGVFQASYVIPVPVSTKVYTFSYTGIDTKCLPAVYSKNVVPV
jgi:hypothetical protein